MWRFALALCAVQASAFADGFSFTIGSPVAAREAVAKTAAFVFRTEGCSEPAKSQIAGTAEGIVSGARRTVALKVTPMTRPGVYAIYQTWPAEGAWVVNLKGTCANATAGAVIPIGPKGFLREASRFFPRPATDAEVESSLKALTQGGSK